MKKVYKLTLLAIFSILILSVSLSASAYYEVLNGVRWWHNSYTNGKYVNNIKLNSDHMTTPWANEINRAITNWHTYGGGKVSITKTSISVSNVDLYVLPSWSYYPKDANACTTIYSESGNAYNGITATSLSFGNYINYASIDFNGTITNWGITPGMNRAKTIGHEIGHCMNLDHQYSQNSIMLLGWDLSYSNYDRPTSVDVSDLNQMYQRIYGS